MAATSAKGHQIALVPARMIRYDTLVGSWLPSKYHPFCGGQSAGHLARLSRAPPRRDAGTTFSADGLELAGKGTARAQKN